MNNKFRRSLFAICWFCFARWNPRGTLFQWRMFLLKLFGAKIQGAVYVYSSVKIWDPKKLTMYAGATLDEGVLIYNVAQITIGERAIVSRDAKLCTATHNYNLNTFNLITKPILINNDAWICMDVFIAPGIKVGAFAIALARSVVLNDLPSYEIHIGNPAKFKSMRKKIKRQYA
jgi:putative colanic acid biosynthesis acetyltransferase WcaF